jgi:hypothetical protein
MKSTEQLTGLSSNEHKQRATSHAVCCFIMDNENRVFHEDFRNDESPRRIKIDRDDLKNAISANWYKKFKHTPDRLVLYKQIQFLKDCGSIIGQYRNNNNKKTIIYLIDVDRVDAVFDSLQQKWTAFTVNQLNHIEQNRKSYLEKNIHTAKLDTFINSDAQKDANQTIAHAEIVSQETISQNSIELGKANPNLLIG